MENRSKRFRTVLEFRAETLVLLCSALFVIFYNTAFFDNIFQQYSGTAGNITFMLSLGIFHHEPQRRLLSTVRIGKPIVRKAAAETVPYRR